MGLLALDTFEAVKELRDLGMAEGQATAIVKIVSRSAEAHIANLATKDELKTEITRLENRISAETSKLDNRLSGETSKLEHKIELSAAELHGEIAELKSDLIKWLLGSQALLLGALVGLSKFTQLLG